MCVCTCVCACVCVCMCACVHACVRAYVCVRVCGVSVTRLWCTKYVPVGFMLVSCAWTLVLVSMDCFYFSFLSLQ